MSKFEVILILMLVSGSVYSQCRADGKYDGVLFVIDEDIPNSLIFKFKGKNLFVPRDVSTSGFVFYFPKPDNIEVRDIGFSDNKYVIDTKSAADGMIKGKCLRVLKLIKVYLLQISSDKSLIFQVNKGKPNSIFIRTDATIDVPLLEKRTFTATFRRDFVYNYEVDMKILYSKGKKEEQNEEKIKVIISGAGHNDSENGLLNLLLSSVNLGVNKITYQIIDK